MPHLGGDWTLTGELGLVSDRNFLEQYFELEWDTFKDESTDLDLKRLVANSSYEITGEVRPNGFVTDTQWLPRGDHFLFGQPLLFDRLSWHEHTSVGYAQMLVASQPTDPAQTAVISRLLFGTVNSLTEWYRPDGGLSADALADALVATTFDGLRTR